MPNAVNITPVCDVVMLAWNKRATTQRCVESYLLHTRLPTRLILIDNASTDDTAAYLSSLKSTPYCDIQVVINKENRGFVGGMNQGIALSSAPYVCLANNDLLFTEGWLEEILAVFKKYPQVGLLNPNSNNLGAKIPDDIPLDVYARQLAKKNAGIFVEMPDCVGFCMFIPRKVMQAVGGLSEEFQPMFFEDTDYSKRVSRAGYLVGVACGAYVWHEEHASMNQLSDNGKSVFDCSLKAFQRKWGKISRVLYVTPSRQVTQQELDSCIDLARNGYYVTIAAKQLPVSPEALFKQYNRLENYGISFFSYGYIPQLILRAIFKKKKYHAVIAAHCYWNGLFRVAGLPVLLTPENLYSYDA
jgi:GT2 family glycosyltransferase